MINILLDLIHTYLNLYRISLTVSFIFLWIALSYVDRIHLRERARRLGLYVSTIIAYLLINTYIYDKFRLIVIRPFCAVFETLTGFLEGVENFEATILLVDNNDPYLKDIKSETLDDLKNEKKNKEIENDNNIPFLNPGDALADRYHKITTRDDETCYHRIHHSPNSNASNESNASRASVYDKDYSVINKCTKISIDHDKIDKILNAPAHVTQKCEFDQPVVSDDEKSEDLCSREGGIDTTIIINPTRSKPLNQTLNQHKKVSLSSGIKNTHNTDSTNIHKLVSTIPSITGIELSTDSENKVKSKEKEVGLVKVDKIEPEPHKDITTKSQTDNDFKQFKTPKPVSPPLDSDSDDSSDSEENHKILIDKNKTNVIEEESKKDGSDDNNDKDKDDNGLKKRKKVPIRLVRRKYEN